MRQLISLQNEAAQGEMASPNRWMISYADFITLLFVLFLVLYSRLPKPNEVSLPEARPLHAQKIPEIRPRLAQAQARAAVQPQIQERQQALAQELALTLDDLIGTGDITLSARPEGVLLEIRDTALFASGTAQPSAQSAAILARISEVFGRFPNPVNVEGHTDSMPIQNEHYPSNWELSSARAAAVVRVLQERGISPDRLTASGLADTRPRGSNATAQGRSENRRVSLLILDNR